MARTSFQPEREKPERRYGRDDPDFGDTLPATPARKTKQDDSDPEPEFASVEDFIEYVLDCERDFFTTDELVKLAGRTRTPNSALRQQLEGYGLAFHARVPERKFRTFGDNPHNRWIDSGCHGGGGGDQILGFAGQRG